MKKVPVLVAAIVVILWGCFLYYDNDKSISFTGAYENVQPPEKISSVKKEGIASGKYIKAFVIDVVDGDTMEVTYKGESHKVRLLYVDTPESVKRGVKVQVYGKEAAKFTEEMVMEKSVRLIFERDIRDRYGRLLAHVFTQDGAYLNGLLVRNGFARVEIVRPNNSYEDYFYGLLEESIRDKVGLWELPGNKRPFIKDEDGKYKPRYLLER